MPNPWNSVAAFDAAEAVSVAPDEAAALDSTQTCVESFFAVVQQQKAAGIYGSRSGMLLERSVLVSGMLAGSRCSGLPIPAEMLRGDIPGVAP